MLIGEVKEQLRPWFAEANRCQPDALKSLARSGEGYLFNDEGLRLVADLALVCLLARSGQQLVVHPDSGGLEDRGFTLAG